jgi:hypothetical protein
MADDQIQPERRRERRRDEEYDDRPRRRSRRRDDDDDDDDDLDRIRRKDSGLETIIPYHNPMALTGYYLGVFSLIPCIGLGLGPAALILGCIGINRRNRNPEIGGLGHAITALVLGAITSLGNWGLVAIGVIAALMR